jgi:hypothetical protein
VRGDAGAPGEQERQDQHLRAVAPLLLVAGRLARLLGSFADGDDRARCEIRGAHAEEEHERDGAAVERAQPVDDGEGDQDSSQSGSAERFHEASLELS